MSRLIQTRDTCVVPATGPVIDLLWARKYVRALEYEEDDLIASWVQAAAEHFQEYTGRQILRATWELWLDGFPAERMIELPHPPLLSVASVSYVSADGSSVSAMDGGSPESPIWQAMTPTGIYARRGYVELKPWCQWPTARSESAAVRIRYDAGYGDTAGDVPDAIRAVLLRMVADHDRFRGQLNISEGARLEELPIVGPQMYAFMGTAMSSQVLHRP